MLFLLVLVIILSSSQPFAAALVLPGVLAVVLVLLLLLGWDVIIKWGREGNNLPPFHRMSHVPADGAYFKSAFLVRGLMRGHAQSVYPPAARWGSQHNPAAANLQWPWLFEASLWGFSPLRNSFQHFLLNANTTHMHKGSRWHHHQPHEATGRWWAHISPSSPSAGTKKVLLCSDVCSFWCTHLLFLQVEVWVSEVV